MYVHFRKGIQTSPIACSQQAPIHEPSLGTSETLGPKEAT